MANSRRKFLFGAIAAVAALGIIVAVMIAGRSPKKESDYGINVAFNIPLTGGLATYGVSIRDGAILAAEEIQVMDNSIKISCDFQDNASEPKNAVSIFMKQKNEAPDYYVSGVKPQTMSIIDRVEEMNIPHFTWIFDAFVTENYENVFRTWVNYKMEPSKIFQYIDEIKPKKIAITYVQLPHTEEEYLKIIIPELEKRGIDYIVEKYAIEKNEFRDVALKFKSFAPDLILINGFSSNLIPLVKNFQENSLFDGKNALFTYDLLDASEDLSNELLEGLKLVIPSYEIQTNNVAWKDKFTKRFHRVPRYTDAYAYDMMYAIYHAKKTSKDHDVFQNLQSVNFDGITGRFKFDPTGDLMISLDIAEYHNGKLQHAKK